MSHDYTIIIPCFLSRVPLCGLIPHYCHTSLSNGTFYSTNKRCMSVNSLAWAQLTDISMTSLKVVTLWAFSHWMERILRSSQMRHFQAFLHLLLLYTNWARRQLCDSQKSWPWRVAGVSCPVKRKCSILLHPKPQFEFHESIAHFRSKTTRSILVHLGT